MSRDGSTAIVGGDQDGAGLGAVWVFTGSGGAWTQQGGVKLLATGAEGAAWVFVTPVVSVTLAGFTQK